MKFVIVVMTIMMVMMVMHVVSGPRARGQIRRIGRKVPVILVRSLFFLEVSFFIRPVDS